MVHPAVPEATPDPERGRSREFTRRDFFLAGALAVGTISAVGTYFTPGGSTPPSVTIRYLVGADSSGSRDLLVSMWNDANPRATVQVVEVGGESTFDQRNAIKTLIDQGKADVINMDVIHIPYFRDRELIRPIDLDNSSDFISNTLLPGRGPATSPAPTTGTTPEATTDPSASENPQYWAVPYSTDVGMIFQRIGATSPPGGVPTLAALTDGRVPVPRGQFLEQLLPAGSRSHEALVVNVLEQALSRDPEILDASTGMPKLSLDRWQEALRPLRDALNAGRIGVTDTEDASAAVFRQRQLSYMRNWPVRYHDLQITGDNDSLTRKVRLGPLPNGVLGGGSLAVAAKSPQADRAEDFIRFLTSTSAQKILAQLAVAPARTAGYDEHLETFVPHLLSVRDAVEATRPRPISARYQEFSDVAYRYFADFVRGTDLPTTFIDDVQQALGI